MDHAVADLHDVDVSGDDIGCIEREGNLKAEHVAIVTDVFCGKDDRNFGRDRHRVIDEHELLQDFVPELVVRYRLQDELRIFHRRILLR